MAKLYSRLISWCWDPQPWITACESSQLRPRLYDAEWSSFPGLKEGQRDRGTVVAAVVCSSAGRQSESPLHPHLQSHSVYSSWKYHYFLLSSVPVPVLFLHPCLILWFGRGDRRPVHTQMTFLCSSLVPFICSTKLDQPLPQRLLMPPIGLELLPWPSWK
ncbi:hypothetical protein ILYODFUR_021812 [Ilyodon furcidens]|uniref:Uncharacterized protein n=1 Tax=Ilyodon furcidens TaxID=33524 RepID=A0ABV0V5S1_9TELE